MSTPDFASRPPRVRFAALVLTGLILVVALAVLVFFVLPGRGTPTVAPTPGASSSTVVVQPSPPEQTGAPVTTIPTAAPAGVTWKLIGQVAVPYSTTDGPIQTTANRSAGFARTPIGALIAATQISTRAGYSAGRDSWEPALQEQFVASPDRDALLKIMRDAATAGQPVASAGELSQIAGFRFYSYTADSAVVGLVRRTPQGSYAMTTLTVAWQGGDWKVVAPAAGQWPSATTTLSNLAGVVAWGAS